jgi:peptidyl-prolyl cis-trans isomerase D
MLRSIQQRDLDRNRWIKITMTVILVLICLSMVITLIPGLYSGSVGAQSPDTVASVGSQNITVTDVQRQLNQITQRQAIPPMLKGLYAKQILDQIVFQHALELEGERLGIRVTPEEETERIKQIVPTAWSGDTWLKDRYAQEVQLRAGMPVDEFETFLRNQMLIDKFRAVVTDGISVTPAEIEQEFRRRNEKVQIEYALVKPADLAGSIHSTDAEMNAYYSKNAAKYQLPERRSVRYALLDAARLRGRAQVPDAALRAYYNSHIEEYRVQNRAHVQHILFKTIGKTDAEVAEIRAKAQDVLSKAKKGGNFEELAKKFSEDDSTKPKGGDLGWIIEGQTVPEFQQAALNLPKGSISDLVKTAYGFHIIKVIDRETAHTKSFEEVRDTIVPILLDEKARQDANDVVNQMASAVRQSNRQPIEDIAKKFGLELGEVPPVAATDPVGAMGDSADLHQVLFQLRAGELSSPLQVPQGFAIVAVKEIQPAHQGTLDEVRGQVLADYQRDKSAELAEKDANELVKLVQGGQPFDKAAKSLNLTVKTPDAFARTGSVPELGSAKPLEPAFGMSVGQLSAATHLGGNWLVYRVAGHQPVNPGELASQSEQIRQQLLQTRQSAAFDAFRTALEDRLKAEGKLVINAEALKRLTRTS